MARAELRQLLLDLTSYYNPGLVDALRAAFTDEELKELVLTLPGPGRIAAAQAVRERDPAFLEQFLLQPRNQEGYVVGAVEGGEVLRSLYPRLSRRGKLVTIAYLRAEWGPEAPGWRELLQGETDPAVRQQILYEMGDFPALMAALDRDGAFPENSFWRYWDWIKEMVQQYPDSFLARGIRAYEAVRGAPYFDLDRWSGSPELWGRWEYGDRYYDPDREIPGWLEFLQSYRNHPAADDAAYRLGRSYEIRGQWAEALRWLYTAATLPDGDMAYHARGRIAWLLDARLDEPELQRLAADPPVAELKPLIEYTLAVRALRAGRYGEAVARLDEVLARYEGAAPLPVTPYTGSYLWWDGLWAGIRQQRQQAARLQELAQRDDPESRYALAAAMYHDEYLFYNYLWSYGRQEYLGYYRGHFGGHGLAALQGDMDPAYRRWVEESNNYIQAARAFARLADAPADIAARALYSRGLALTRLLHYGSDVFLWQMPDAIVREAVAAFAAVVEKFPRHELAADALLSLGYLRRDPAYFERILREYPHSDAAAAARQARLPEYPGLPNYIPVPFRYLDPAEAPAAVRDWVEAHRHAPFAGTLTLGDVTYVLVTTGTPDGWVDLTADYVWEQEDLTAPGRVEVRPELWPGRRGTGLALARLEIPAVPVTVMSLSPADLSPAE
ncbi:MAG: hypothetical protein DIU70_003860 [Bacillota bacterium]